MDIAHRREPRFSGAGRRGEAMEFRVLIALSFAIFLAIETLSRLVPRRLFSRASIAPRGSIIAEARAAAYRIVPQAFMG